MNVRGATEQDINSIVEVHISAFPGFFLTTLGRSFLSELYVSFMTRKTGVLRVVCNGDDVVVGFSAGTSNPEYFYAQLRKDKWFQFLTKSISGLIRNPLLVIRKLFYAFSYKGDTPADIHEAALLSSIGVSPAFAGQSLGKLLLKDFEIQIESLGIPSVYLTTDKFGNDPVVGFYQRCNYKIESDFIQAGSRHMLRLMKTLKPENINDNT